MQRVLQVVAATVAMAFAWGHLTIGATGCFPSYDHLFDDVDERDAPLADTEAEVEGDVPDVVEGDADATSAPPDATEPRDTDEVSDTRSEDAAETTVDTHELVDGDVVVPECVNAEDCTGSVGPCQAAECVDGSCTTVPVTGSCDDGDPCTTEDVCDGGACVGRAWTAAESTGWLVSFDGPGTDMANALVVHPSGDVSVVGSFEGTATLAGQQRTARGTGGHPDAFVARLDASGGTDWVAQAGGPGLDAALYAAADGEDLVTAGWFSETATFGAGASEVAVTAAGERGQSFIARYGPTGALVRLWRFPGFVRALEVAEDGSGDLLVAGVFREQAVFAGIAGPITVTAVGGLDAYVARLTAAGEARWVGRIGSAGDEGAAGPAPIQIVARPSGGVTVVVGIASAPAGYRTGGVTTSLGVTVEEGIGFAQARLDLDASGGVVAVSVLGALPTFRFVSALVALDGGVVLSGGEAGLLADGEMDPSGPPPRLFVERVDAGGAVEWSKQIAGSGAFIGSVPLLAYAARSAQGDVLVLGSFDGGDVVFDYGAPLSPAVSADGPGPRIFVVRYDLDGNVLSGVASPAGGVVPLNDWVYRSGLRVEGAPELVLPQPRLSVEGAVCIAVPGLRQDFQATALPGEPWLTTSVELQGIAGIAYCVAASRIIGCSLDE